MLIRLNDLIERSARRAPEAIALVEGGRRVRYRELQAAVLVAANRLQALGLRRGDRVAVHALKRVEAVVAMFAVARAGGVFVPVNPVLKAAQIEHILQDSGAVLWLSPDRRWSALSGNGAAAGFVELAAVASMDAAPVDASPSDEPGGPPGLPPEPPAQPGIGRDPAAILYTSGSTGKAKGVVLSHANFVAGALSVASYLENRASDRLLAALPLSFDAGFSQLTTGFAVGATVVLHEYLLAQDCLKVMAREAITGLTAVPPLWIQLAERAWPEAAVASLRYFANTGGRMPASLLARLRERAPGARPFLMYGLTEAFRSTYLPPEEVDRRPDSIGKAIPGAEILVLDPQGRECAPDEPGELVHRGPTVTLGYWNDPVRTAERFRPLPAAGLPLPEIAVFSGDVVRRDAQGFLYFVGRRDEQIKTSGYRVSPTEVEEALYASGLVSECAVFGAPDERLGQRIVAVVLPSEAASPAGLGTLPERLLAACRERLPVYMLPSRFVMVDAPLPRNANGKIDRIALGDRHGSDALNTP